MKLFGNSFFVFGVLLLLVLPVRLSAQLSREMQASAVRIICPEPAENGAKGFDMIPLKLSDGSTVELVADSSGSGFVINNEGFIITNNHVVAAEEDKEVPSPLVMVMQRVGERFILHKAAILWQSANADLAVIRAPLLKALPLAIEFDEAKSTASEEVYSMGYPGIADVAAEDTKRSDEITIEYMQTVLNIRIRRMETELHRRLKQTEIDAIKANVIENTDSIPADWMDMMATLNNFLKNADATVGAWDVTEVVTHKSLWPDFFRPTVTKGNIERFTKIHGFLGATFPDVLMIQHSCAIKHGNSGGPLLNAGGQVLGVVGRGFVKGKKGEVEAVQWATAASELKEWLDAHKVPYTLAGDWRKPAVAPEPIKIIEKQPVIQQLPTQIIQQPTLKIVERLPMKVLVAVSLAVVVAIIVGVIGFLKSNQKPSFTEIFRDPRLARALGTTPSKLVEIHGTKPPHSPPATDHGGWQLVGRTADGGDVRVEMTEAMFASSDYRLILGRTADLCHLVIKDDSVSKQHAHIRKDGDRFLVADRNSSNRTAVNGHFNERAFDEVPLKEGDTLTLGEVRLDFGSA
ncbi:MAG TPA: trypsin-like peptidase domain-containing protein [Chthoniobacter sp.]|jgi:S1-C subfamily serine protease